MPYHLFTVGPITVEIQTTAFAWSWTFFGGLLCILLLGQVPGLSFFIAGLVSMFNVRKA